MQNNFFDTKKTSLGRFWEWFQPDEKQREEIQTLVQSIILEKVLSRAVELTGDKNKLIEKIKYLNQNDEETSRTIIDLFATLERNYNELINEIIFRLGQDELINLQQFLEES